MKAHCLRARSLFGILILGLVALLTSCSGVAAQITPTADTSYLTPIPVATWDAYRVTFPIETRLQAVMTARKGLGEGRLVFADTTRVLSAENMKLAEANQKLPAPGFSYSGNRTSDLSVWLVIFEGDWRLNPPGVYTVTPLPGAHGCAYVVLGAADGLLGEIDTADCPHY